MHCTAQANKNAIDSSTSEAALTDSVIRNTPQGFFASRLYTAQISRVVAERRAHACKPGSHWHKVHLATAASAGQEVAAIRAALDILYNKPEAEALRLQVAPSVPLCNLSVRDLDCPPLSNGRPPEVTDMKTAMDVRIQFLSDAQLQKATIERGSRWRVYLPGCRTYEVEVLR